MAITLCCSGYNKLTVAPDAPPQTLWCAMDPKSTVSFSSIGETKAMLSVNRTVFLKNSKIEQSEYPVSYDRKLSVEQNLLNCAARLITEKGKEK
jgi:hypothetical protein